MAGSAWQPRQHALTMADYRLPGPVCTSTQTLLLDDGTLAQRTSQLPGCVADAAPEHASDYDPRTLWRRAMCVQEAYEIGLRGAPQAILRETGYELGQLLKGLLPGLLAMMGVIGATTVLGGAIGGIIGALAGGVGAAPGAAIGAQAGMDIGTALLTWLGLGFLVVAIGRGLMSVSSMVGEAVGLAWDAHGTSQRQRDVQKSGELFADAAAKLFLLIPVAIVARLTFGQANAATAKSKDSRASSRPTMRSPIRPSA